MGLFGTSRKEAWGAFAEEVNGEVIKLGNFKGDGVLVHYKTFEILLDPYMITTGDTTIMCTRMRTTFINPNAVAFKIYHRSIFSGLGKMLGMQDIEIGDMAFDEAFIIKGNDVNTITRLFNRTQIKRSIMAEPKLALEIKHKNEWLQKKLKENESILEYQSIGIIKDVPRLVQLCDLFKEILDAFIADGNTSETLCTTSLND